ncbi:23S rRNA (uracil-C(5))-methyltransferase RlmCD [Lachnospiraceae bacterium]|nr:23S rRNA (uracil-C(5))-methyltransferase RlmCD [Lachnospiraceae bacterium]
MIYEKNQLLEVEIVDMSSEGEGIGKAQGYPFFVKDTVIGDVAQIRITRVKKNYGYGRLEKVLAPSPFRVEPECKFHRQCGGCQIQAMDYQQQLQFKEAKIKNNLIRIGGFAPELVGRIMEPVLGMDVPFGYRNKAQYPVGEDKEGGPIAGFYAGRTHTIIANTRCALGVKENEEILETILSYMKKNRVPAYDELTGKGTVRHVLIRKGYHSGEIMVCLVVNLGQGKGAPCLPAQDQLIKALSEIPGMASVSLSINTEKTNVIMGKDFYTIWGKETIEDTIYVRDAKKNFQETGQGITFSLSPLSFYQVNPVQTEKIYSVTLDYAGLTGKETVWDLYCGIGTISLFLAGNAKWVYGVESVPRAVVDAWENARKNGIGNVSFFAGQAEEVLPDKYGKEGITADVVVVDPPRKGCGAECLETILKMAPERIVYVSCDSATLARDLKVLCEGGYEIVRGRGIDLFPMTVHVETCVLLSKLKTTQHIEVKIDLDEMDLTKAESKATYAEIKQYVLDKFGLKVSQLYIAQVKRKHGIIERTNYNIGEGKARVPQVPLEKEKAIEDALKHFKMI